MAKNPAWPSEIWAGVAINKVRPTMTASTYPACELGEVLRLARSRQHVHRDHRQAMTNRGGCAGPSVFLRRAASALPNTGTAARIE